jgi:hypothetical protein
MHGIRYATHADMKAASFKYIEVLYNRKRQHSTLGYRSPIQFLENWIKEQHQKKTGSMKLTLWQTKNRGNLPPLFTR